MDKCVVNRQGVDRRVPTGEPSGLNQGREEGCFLRCRESM